MKGTAYFIQGVLIILWWTALYLDNSFYSAFQFDGIGHIAFNALAVPDLVAIVLLSIVRAYYDLKQLEYIILGGFIFATLYCISASILTSSGYLGTTVMTLGLCYNLFLVLDRYAFRASTSNNIYINGFKTLVQIICVWIITLFVFPALIMKSFGLEILTSSLAQTVAIALFIFFGALGLYSAFIMVKTGDGTPLPIDQTNNLVLTGPYKYVRNPMAIAGLGQAVAVSLFLGSFAVLLYTLLGALLWQFVVRPIEERDMIKRFGSEYEAYRQRVRCWIPRWK